MARPVRLPWPISAAGTATTMAPSGLIVTHAPIEAGLPPSARAAAGRKIRAVGILRAKVSPAAPSRNPRREIVVISIIFMAHASLLSGALDGAEDAWIGAAATNIPVHVTNDVVAARILLACEQRSRLHDLSGLAVTALRHLQIHPGLLQRMVAIGREAFDGGNSLPRYRCDRRLTGTHGATVQMHGTSAAHPGAATIFRAGKFEVLAHHPKQRCIWRGVNIRQLAVDGETEGHEDLSALRFDVSFRLCVRIKKRARCEIRRPDNRLRPCVLELRQIGVLDVLILDLKDASLGPATAFSELEVAHDGLKRAISRKLCELCVVKRPGAGYRLLDDLHLGVGLRSDIVAKGICARVLSE